MAATSGAVTGATSVTVLGTGLMGSGIARSLVRAGHDVAVWNRTPDKATWLADEAGIKSVDNLTDALGGADFVLTMLFDSEAVWQIMHEALPAAPKHTIWVEASTVGATQAARLAEQGELIVLAAGDARLRDRMAPVFDAIGAPTIWVDEQPGDGHRLKLIANSWVLSVTGATAQSIGFARRLGIDPQLFLDVISGGPLDCGYAQVKSKAILEGDLTSSSGLHGAAKDSELILSGTADAGTDERLMRALRDTFTEVPEDADEDMAAVVLAFTR